jgi:hypothetical protein
MAPLHCTFQEAASMIRCTCRSGTPVTEAASFAVMSIVGFAGIRTSKIVPIIWKQYIACPDFFQRFLLPALPFGPGLYSPPNAAPEAPYGSSPIRVTIPNARSRETPNSLTSDPTACGYSTPCQVARRGQFHSPIASTRQAGDGPVRELQPRPPFRQTTMIGLG